MAEFGEVQTDTTLTRTIMIMLNDMEPGATAPSKASAGTSPRATGYQLDSTSKSLLVNMAISADMELSVNPTFTLNFSLSGAETNGDTLDMTMDYLILQNELLSANEPVTKTSTQITAQTTVNTTDGLSGRTSYSITFTFDAADANNPFNAHSKFMIMEFKLTNVTGVGDVVVYSGSFNYEAEY